MSIETISSAAEGIIRSVGLQFAEYSGRPEGVLTHRKLRATELLDGKRTLPFLFEVDIRTLGDGFVVMVNNGTAFDIDEKQYRIHADQPRPDDSLAAMLAHVRTLAVRHSPKANKELIMKTRLEVVDTLRDTLLAAGVNFAESPLPGSDLQNPLRQFRANHPDRSAAYFEPFWEFAVSVETQKDGKLLCQVTEFGGEGAKSMESSFHVGPGTQDVLTVFLERVRATAEKTMEAAPSLPTP